MRHAKAIERILVFAVLLGTVSCGASEVAPPPAAPKHAARKRPRIKRSLSPEQLAHTMKGRAAEMAACYELSPAKEKELAGALTVDFTVEPSGKVSGESLVEDSIADKLLGECVLGVVKKTAFPRAEAAIDVSWPVRFVPR